MLTCINKDQQETSFVELFCITCSKWHILFLFFFPFLHKIKFSLIKLIVFLQECQSVPIWWWWWWWWWWFFFFHGSHQPTFPEFPCSLVMASWKSRFYNWNAVWAFFFHVEVSTSHSHKLLQIFWKVATKFFKSCPKLLDFSKNLLRSCSLSIIKMTATMKYY